MGFIFVSSSVQITVKLHDVRLAEGRLFIQHLSTYSKHFTHTHLHTLMAEDAVQGAILQLGVQRLAQEHFNTVSGGAEGRKCTTTRFQAI